MVKRKDSISLVNINAHFLQLEREKQEESWAQSGGQFESVIENKGHHSIRRFHKKIFGSSRHLVHFELDTKSELKMEFEDTDPLADHLPCLVLARLEKVQLKDFAQEMQAVIDFEKILGQSSIILNLEGSNAEIILHNMIKRVHDQLQSQNSEQSQSSFNCSFDTFYADISKSLFMNVNYSDYNYKRLSKTLRGIQINEHEGIVYDPTWICALCTSAFISQRHVIIARLKSPVNLGRSSEGVSFIILVIENDKKKMTKLDVETGRTCATLFYNSDFRTKLMRSPNEGHFRELLITLAKRLNEEQLNSRKKSIPTKDVLKMEFSHDSKWPMLNGIREDLKRRIPNYISDYRDSFKSVSDFRKTMIASILVYLSCLLPALAYGLLNDVNTFGKLKVSSILISQTAGGLFFSIFGGQPMIVLQTSMPLTLYYHVLYKLSEQFLLEYNELISTTGLITCLLLMLMSIFDCSSIMQWSTKSTEEIFTFFTFTTSLYYVTASVYSNFQMFYLANNTSSIYRNISSTMMDQEDPLDESKREVSILYLILVIGTVWFTQTFLKSTKTPFLNSSKRQFLSDFSIPFSVILMTLFGSYFDDIGSSQFKWIQLEKSFQLVRIDSFMTKNILISVGASIPMSILIFFDHNITSVSVNSNKNKLTKGSAYNWDLFVLSLINGTLSLAGLPMIYGSSSQSYYHIKVLADLDEKIGLGHQISQTVTQSRETRVSGILSHLLMALSLRFLFPYPFQYIPNGVLYGLTLSIAVISIANNQILERILIFFTEQGAYPPSHYLKKVPLQIVYTYTLLQVLQIALLSAIAFCPVIWLNILVPFFIVAAIPIRHYIIPKFIPEKFLEAMDKQ